MVIQTLERGFTVTSVLKSGDGMDVFVCRDLLLDSKQKYTILCLKSPELIYKSIPFFTSQRANTAFDDFVECFSKDGNFYVVFRYYDQPLFFKQLETRDYTTRERIEIGRSLMSRMTLLEMPPSIQYEVLRADNLLLDEALTVRFNYILTDVRIYDMLSLDQTQTELAGVLRVLFEQALENKICGELNELISRLENREFHYYLEIYRAYDKVYNIMKDMMEQGPVQPQNFWFKLWERIKKLAHFAKPVLAGVVVAIAFGYLVYTLANPPVHTVAAGTEITIHQIGTVMIE